MTAYLEDPHALYPHAPHLPCAPPYVLRPPQQQPPLPGLPPPPPPPLLCPPPRYRRTPLKRYPPRRHYNPYHHPPTPSPHPLTPSYFVGTWSKDNFITIVSYMLDTAARLNNDFVALPTYTQPESVYFSVSRPDIPTADYVRRLVTYTRCSPAAFVLMLIYIDRIAAVNRLLLVTPYNMHRLLVTALTLACKYLDDRCYSNVHYAKVGGIPTAREMNRLELQFLKYLDYGLHVDFDHYKNKLSSLMDVSPPASPTSIMYAASPVTPVAAVPPVTPPSTSPTSVIPQIEHRPPMEHRPPLPVERTLDFEGRYAMGRMLDDNPAIDVSVDPPYPPHPKPAFPQHHNLQRIPHDKWFHWDTPPRPPPQRSIPKAIPKRPSRRDHKHASLDPRFYRATHPSAVPVRYAECAP